MKALIYESIGELSKKLCASEISSEELTRAFVDQIEKLDDSIGAYLHFDPVLAIERAIAIDLKRQKKQILSPISGIPMAIKDNICTSDMPTTCASKMLEGYMSPFDAHVVKKLRANDAIILGKLNMDEFAMGASTETSYFKKTRNPVDMGRVPGGSSGGPAAAVAAFEAAYTLGSDTGGSIRQPAAFCGVSGLKPTYGTISRSGLIAFASSLDQIGPIAKNVEDLAFVYTALAGHDPMDSTSSERMVENKDALIGENIEKLRVALPMNYLREGIQKEVKDAVLEAAKTFESIGVTVEPVEIENMEYALPAYYLLSSAEASSNLAKFDGIQYGYRHSGFDSIGSLYNQSRGFGFGTEVKRRILLGTYALSSGYYDAYYLNALRARQMVKETFDKLFESFDVILTPVAPTTAYKFGEHSKNPVEMYLGDIYTVPVNIAGLPALSTNCGFDDDEMPIGMQLIGKAFSEKVILSLGLAFEKEFAKKEVVL
ncbi:MAG: Asp-tRNA(Asn)/Glu-tRNA(Gln) amidotransferase subunit GatA [Clostridia bacterium]|nr:Asp-tRNA(Asn)/Glu-tRNA(Gln) amidotransferase subunit GatA [Clostridia bacterium]